MPELSQSIESRHNKFAPYWAIGFLVLCLTGLSTIWIDGGPFWKGYVLDMTGPAWAYILFRGRYTAAASNTWTRFFTPGKILILFTLALFSIEGAQYLKLYDATFDPWDLLAYVSILFPLYLLDLLLLKEKT